PERDDVSRSLPPTLGPMLIHRTRHRDWIVRTSSGYGDQRPPGRLLESLVPAVAARHRHRRQRRFFFSPPASRPSCGTLQVAVAVLVLPARSVAVAVIVYTRPLPCPARSARSWTEPPVITMSRATSPIPVPVAGSLLVALTVGVPAMPDSAS